MSRRVRIMIGAAIALVTVLVLVAVAGLVAGCGSSGNSSSSGAMRTAGQAASVPEPVTGSDSGAATKSESGGAASGQDFAAAIPPTSAPSTHYLVRTGDLSLLVAGGTLLPAVDRIKSMTTALNGYVMSSAVGSRDAGSGSIEPLPLDTAVSSDGAATSSALDARGAPYASLVVRVPEQFFDAAIKRFSTLGEVQSVTTSSEDVTSQYVDLRARLTHYRAVERRLVAFLSQTTTVSQMLAVQDRIDKVQLTIEELTAQLKSMQETTTYGTLSVYVSEKGRTPVVAHAGSSFGGTLRSSIELLGRGFRAAALVATAMLPWLVVFGAAGAVAWYAVRRVRRSRRQTAQPSTPA
jgi:Domain of unknown function (DUF4349)